MIRFIKHSIGQILRYARVSYLRLSGASVGKNNFISMGAWIDTRRGKIIIGNNCTITHGSKILSHDHAAHIMGDGMYEKTLTTIGDNVFIGMNAIILSGITIGDNSIIAAGSIVTKDVPPGSLLVGASAKIIKTLNPVTKKWENTPTPMV